MLQLALRVAALGAALLAIESVALAQDLGGEPPADPRLARGLDASPDTPSLSLAWRRWLRGTVGAPIPLVEPGDAAAGFSLELLGLVELHNERADGFPNNLWRGRLALEAAYRWTDAELGLSRGLSVGIALEHESDHATAPREEDVGYLTVNDVAATSAVRVARRRWALTANARARLYFLSCTRDDLECPEASGTAGDVALGAAAGVVLDAGGRRPADGALVPFAALASDGILPHGKVLGEARAEAHLGVSVRRARAGLLQVYAVGTLGNDLGFLRAHRVAQLGAAFRWVP